MIQKLVLNLPSDFNSFFIGLVNHSLKPIQAFVHGTIDVSFVECFRDGREDCHLFRPRRNGALETFHVGRQHGVRYVWVVLYCLKNGVGIGHLRRLNEI